MSNRIGGGVLALVFMTFVAASTTGTFSRFFFVVLVLVVTVGLYLLPTIQSIRRKQPNTTAIIIVNVALGWTLVGWVVAMVWAVKEPEPVIIASRPTTLAGEPPRPMKTCPACAEDVLAAALLCKHCNTVFVVTNAPAG